MSKSTDRRLALQTNNPLYLVDEEFRPRLHDLFHLIAVGCTTLEEDAIDELIVSIEDLVTSVVF